jgi:hypothetical protein
VVKLKNNVEAFKLDNNLRAKGGKSRSKQKQLAGWLRRYSNPNLNCSNCRKRCELYKKGDTGTCKKAELIKGIQKLCRGNPEEIFSEVFRNLIELKIKSISLKGTPLCRYNRLYDFTNLSLDVYKAKLEGSRGKE